MNLLAKVDKRTELTETGKEVTLSGTEAVTTEVDKIGYPYAVEFELCPDSAPNIDAILFKGPHSEFVSNWQNTGKFAFVVTAMSSCSILIVCLPDNGRKYVSRETRKALPCLSTGSFRKDWKAV